MFHDFTWIWSPTENTVTHYSNQKPCHNVDNATPIQGVPLRQRSAQIGHCTKKRSVWKSIAHGVKNKEKKKKPKYVETRIAL